MLQRCRSPVTDGRAFGLSSVRRHPWRHPLRQKGRVGPAHGGPGEQRQIAQSGQHQTAKSASRGGQGDKGDKGDGRSNGRFNELDS